MVPGRGGQDPIQAAPMPFPPDPQGGLQTHMGGFLGSPWNFIFLEEFAAAGGARISLSSLCGESWKGHTYPISTSRHTPHHVAPCRHCLSCPLFLCQGATS